MSVRNYAIGTSAILIAILAVFGSTAQTPLITLEKPNARKTLSASPPAAMPAPPAALPVNSPSPVAATPTKPVAVQAPPVPELAPAPSSSPTAVTSAAASPIAPAVAPVPAPPRPLPVASQEPSAISSKPVEPPEPALPVVGAVDQKTIQHLAAESAKLRLTQTKLAVAKAEADLLAEQKRAAELRRAIKTATEGPSPGTIQLPQGVIVPPPAAPPPRAAVNAAQAPKEPEAPAISVAAIRGLRGTLKAVLRTDERRAPRTVGEGEKFDDYTVASITRNEVVLVDGKGKKLTLAVGRVGSASERPAPSVATIAPATATTAARPAVMAPMTQPRPSN